MVEIGFIRVVRWLGEILPGEAGNSIGATGKHVGVRGWCGSIFGFSAVAGDDSGSVLKL
jgi:hypothetical protein